MSVVAICIFMSYFIYALINATERFQNEGGTVRFNRVLIKGSIYMMPVVTTNISVTSCPAYATTTFTKTKMKIE